MNPVTILAPADPKNRYSEFKSLLENKEIMELAKEIYPELTKEVINHE